MRVPPTLRRPAFSLLEMLITMAIIALLASMLLVAVGHALRYVRSVVKMAGG